MEQFIEQLIKELQKEYNYQRIKACQEFARVSYGEAPKMVSEEYNRNQNAQCFDIAIQIVNKLAQDAKDNEVLNLVRMNSEIQKSKLEELKRVVTSIVADEWIPCKQRLPEVYTKYLVTCQGVDIPQIRMFEGTWDSIEEVIAWKPLCEVYTLNQHESPLYEGKSVDGVYVPYTGEWK